MDDTTERKLLIAEIAVLEANIVASGSTNVDFSLGSDFAESFSTSDLRAIKQRFEGLVRALGGVKR